MWKRIDNNFYDTLRTAHSSDYAPDYFTYPFIFLLLELLIIVPVLVYGKYPPMFIPLSAAALLITLPFFILGLSSLSKNKNIKKRIAAANNAEYYPAALVSKYTRTAGSGYDNRANLFVRVRLNGKIIKVRTRKDVYSICNEGDSIYVVDLIGEKAANPYTCIAVMNIPENNYNNSFNSFSNDYGNNFSNGFNNNFNNNGYSNNFNNNGFNNSYDDNFNNNFNNGNNTFSGNNQQQYSRHIGTSYNYGQQLNNNMQYGSHMNYSANTNNLIGRVITDEERKYFVGIENRKFNTLKAVTIIFGIGTFALLAAAIIFKIKGDWASEKMCEMFTLIVGIFFAVFLIGFLISITPHKSLIDRFMYENLRVEDVLIKSTARTNYRSGKYSRYHYYYTCKSDQGRVFVVDTRQPYLVYDGCRALVLHMSENGDKPVIYPAIRR